VHGIDAAPISSNTSSQRRSARRHDV
jgi:hypothetical protein